MVMAIDLSVTGVVNEFESSLHELSHVIYQQVIERLASPDEPLLAAFRRAPLERSTVASSTPI